jgi:hypothetical protein
VLWAVWIAKFGLYIGLLVGVGCTFYAGWIGTEPLTPGAGKIVVAALQCGVAATVISVGLSMQEYRRPSENLRLGGAGVAAGC